MVRVRIASVSLFGSCSCFVPLHRKRHFRRDSRRARRSVSGDHLDANSERINDNFRAIATVQETLTNRIEAVNDNLSSRIDAVSSDALQNRSGIALAYALDTPPLLPNKRFAIGCGLGTFSGESAFSATISGKISDSVVAGIGGGFAGSGDSSISGAKANLSFQW